MKHPDPKYRDDTYYDVVPLLADPIKAHIAADPLGVVGADPNTLPGGGGPTTTVTSFGSVTITAPAPGGLRGGVGDDHGFPPKAQPTTDVDVVLPWSGSEPGEGAPGTSGLCRVVRT